MDSKVNSEVLAKRLNRRALVAAVFALLASLLVVAIAFTHETWLLSIALPFAAVAVALQLSWKNRPSLR